MALYTYGLAACRWKPSIDGSTYHCVGQYQIGISSFLYLTVYLYECVTIFKLVICSLKYESLFCLSLVKTEVTYVYIHHASVVWGDNTMLDYFIFLLSPSWCGFAVKKCHERRMCPTIAVEQCRHIMRQGVDLTNFPILLLVNDEHKFYNCIHYYNRFFPEII